MINPFIIGRQEWLALPTLGLPAIRAKIDTGARSSALHAFDIEAYGPEDAPMVRFGVQPVPDRPDIAVHCRAALIGHRSVTSSNGESERRYFIAAEIQMGGQTWPIEISLTNRSTMTYRMLLGRQAIRPGMLIDVNASFRQPRLTYQVYKKAPRRRRQAASRR